jgi:hypothetical protein
MNFGPDGPEKIITRADLKASVHAYEDVRKQPGSCSTQVILDVMSVLIYMLSILQLLNKCATYRATLMAMSRASAGFADAMTSCSMSV